MPEQESAGEVHIITPRHGSRVRVIARDGVQLRVTSRDALAAASISDGDVLTDDAIEHELALVEISAATRRAYTLLEHRERSVAEVHERLEDDGFPAAVASQVVERLRDIGLVDDVRFAEAYTRTKSAARWGRDRIARALSRAGVDDETSSHVLDEALPHDAEVDRALALLPETGLDEHAFRQRHLRRLLAKGYGYDVALAALARRSRGAPTPDSE